MRGRAGQQALYVTLHALGRYPPMQSMVDGDHRGLGTGSEAGVVLEAEPAVRRVALVSQLQGLEAVPLDARGAQDVARGAPAHLQRMLGGRRKAEIRIEGRDAPHVVDGGLGIGRHLLDGSVGKVSHLVVGRVQGGEHGDRGLLLRGYGPPHTISQRSVVVGQPRTTCRVMRVPQS